MIFFLFFDEIQTKMCINIFGITVYTLIIFRVDALPRGYISFSYSTQLSMKFVLLINLVNSVD